MQIFLSYPSEERPLAERVHLALGAAGHEVFFDREDLPPGDEFDRAVRQAMRASALLVFFITPDAVKRGRYTLTELKLAQDQWPQPGGRVLPVMVQPTPIEGIPAYLRAVSILEAHGDLAAEVAHEADRMLASRTLRRRARTIMATPAGIGGLILAIILIATTWILWPRAASNEASLGEAGGLRGVPLQAAVRGRARFIAPTPEGYAVVAAFPPEVVRFDADDRQLGNTFGLPGEPVALRQTPRYLLVATRSPHGIAIVDTEQWAVVDTIPLDRTNVAEDPDARVSHDIASIEIVDGILWVVTHETDGEAALLRLRPNREWVVATSAMAAPPDSLEFDARDLKLEAFGSELWAITTRRNPASLYRIMGAVRVDEVNGNDVPMIRCAHDVAENGSGNMLLLSCDNALQEILAAGRDLTLLQSQQVLPPDSTSGDLTTEIIVPDGRIVFVALNSETSGSPGRARILRVDEQGSVKLFDEPDAVIVSMAVTPRAVLAVFRRADGSWDARRIDRQQ